MEIREFIETLDSTQIFHVVMPTLASVSIIIALFGIYLNHHKKASPTFQNCTFNIQSMNPKELNDENVVNRISECIRLVAKQTRYRYATTVFRHSPQNGR
jgi:hypothetical protein